jgi:hypothetical protein
MRYGHAPTDECSLCHMPHSCTHIAGECPDHEALRISRHIAACQLVHAAIRKTAKGGGSLHSAPDLVLVMADTGTQSMTTCESLMSLSSTEEHTDPYPNPETPPHEWLAPLPTSEDIRRRRLTDVSQDPRYIHRGLSATEGDVERTTAPRRMPNWVLPLGGTQTLF